MSAETATTSAAALAAQYLESYAILVACDFEVTRKSLLRRAIAGVLLGAAITFITALLCACVIAQTWDTPNRTVSIAMLLIPFVGIALVSYWRIAKPSHAVGSFVRTRAEWQKDRHLLDQALDSRKETSS